MTAPLPTLAFLAYHWGDAYLISYAKDRWVAVASARVVYSTGPGDGRGADV